MFVSYSWPSLRLYETRKENSHLHRTWRREEGGGGRGKNFIFFAPDHGKKGGKKLSPMKFRRFLIKTKNEAHQQQRGGEKKEGCGREKLFHGGVF